MGFIIKKNPTVRWPVTYKRAGDGGETETHEFEAVFKRPPQSFVDRIFRPAEGEKAPDDTEVLSEFLVRIEGVCDESGKELGATLKSALEVMEQNAGMKAAVARAFVESILGARLGNLQEPPSTGPAAEPETTAG